MTGTPPSPMDTGDGFANSGGLSMDGGNCQTAGLVHPYGMVAGALGLGFVLGGGVSLRLTGRLAGLGLRLGWMAVLPALKRELAYVFSGSKSHCNER